jgi:hypothetical protein
MDEQKCPTGVRPSVPPSIKSIAYGMAGGPGRTRTCNQTVMSGRL